MTLGIILLNGYFVIGKGMGGGDCHSNLGGEKGIEGLSKLGGM